MNSQKAKIVLGGLLSKVQVLGLQEPPHLEVLWYGPFGLLGELVVKVLPALRGGELLPRSGGIGTLGEGEWGMESGKG